ncbi:MAG TPA: four-carbon acid sugar kinase family protein [Acidothermaceae bacterium]|jgi:uncharacterized protein YgbK (DUF1537 family)
MLTGYTLPADLPADRACPVDAIRAALPGARRVVVLDDDPTGTQTVRDLPVLTRWEIADVQWALRQSTSAFFVLTNSRSLSAADAAMRNREVAEACMEAARSENVDLAFASRSDSTLRGHFPLETDVLTAVSAEAGRPVDGVLVVPAYIDAGRVTIDGAHWVTTGDGLVPVSGTEFARDATFGFRNSNLPAWIEEKSGGRIRQDDVGLISLEEIRSGGPTVVAERLAEARGASFVVVDAVTDDDLRVVVSAVLAVEAQGHRFVYRVGPSFVRARCGQDQSPPLSIGELRELVGTEARAGRGLIVVGSHVALTTRQLARLRGRLPLHEIEVDVSAVLDPDRVAGELSRAVTDSALAMGESHVVLATSRTLQVGSSRSDSLRIAGQVSTAVAKIVAGVAAIRRPAFIVAKGGITSADVATSGLGVVHSWVRGTLLPGIVSLWQPVDGSLPGIPYVVFAGNVGGDDALADVVERLETALSAS